MRTELNIQSLPVERGRIAATLTAESSAESIAVAQASAEVMCRFVGTAVAPYFIIPDTEHMQQAMDVAQVNLPEFRIHFNRFLTARDPADAADALAYLLDNMSFADSAQALIVRPYNWVMMNMLKHAENLQESIAGIYPDIAIRSQGRVLGQAAFDLTTSLQGMTDEEYEALPTTPQVSDLVGRKRRNARNSITNPLELKLSHVVVLSMDGNRGIVLVPRRAGGAFIVEADIPPAQAKQIREKSKKNEGRDEISKDVTINVVRTLRFGLFYRSGSVHYVSPLKELLLIRILIHMQKLFEGNRPFGSNYRYYEPPVKMIAKLQSVFLRIAADSLITATGDLSDYLSSEDGRVLMEGANFAYGYESMPLFLALLACSNSVKTIEQMLLLAQQIKGSVYELTDTVPPVSLEARFVRWVAESLLNPVLEFRNEVLQKAGIIDVPSFVHDPSFVTGAPDVSGITSDSDPQAKLSHTIFGLDRLQLASITELIRLEIADMISAEKTFVDCMRGGYSRVAHVRYNGRYRDLDHMLKLVETHASILAHIVPNNEDVRAAATLPYRQVSFYGPYSAYELGRTVLPVQYGVYDLAARLSKQMGRYANVEAGTPAAGEAEDGSLVNVFSYIQSSIFRYEPRYMFPFFSEDHKAVVKRIELEGTAGHLYAVNEGGEPDPVLSILPEAYRSTKLWANNAPFNQQYREIGLVSPCWDLDTFELLSNLVDLPTDRTYFPAVKPDIVGGRIGMTVDFKKLDPALQRMMDLEFETPALRATARVSIDRVPALASIGVIMPYVPRLAHDLKASWMDDFAMVDITGGIYGTAGTIVLPRDGAYARAAADVDEVDRWRAPSLAEGFQYKSRSAAYGSVPLTFEAE